MNFDLLSDPAFYLGLISGILLCVGVAVIVAILAGKHAESAEKATQRRYGARYEGEAE